MRIVLDGRMAHRTGVGRYVRGLCGALAGLDADHEFAVLVNPGDEAGWIPADRRFRTEVLGRRVEPYSIGEQVFLRGEIRRRRPDLVHMPHFNVPWLAFRPFVVTIHDLIYLLFPEDCPSRLARIGVGCMIRRAVRHAELVMVVSENTRDDLVRLLRADPARIRVVPNGAPAVPAERAEPGPLRRRLGLEGDFLLYAGNHAPHKNLGVLLEAFGTLRGDGFDLRLAITGPVDRHTPPVRARAEALGLADRVVFTGMLPDAELFALYGESRALVFPSLYEGFGLPPLEAFALGVPVVASRAGSIPEVVGDAALLADPHSPAAFAAAVARILREPALREDLARRGRARRSQFTWEATARGTLEAYESARPGARGA